VTASDSLREYRMLCLSSLRRDFLRTAVLCLFVLAVFPPLSRAQAPVFEITPVESTIKFDVKASVNIADHVDVDFHLKGKRVSGPPPDLK
jgi:hypothetical protein